MLQFIAVLSTVAATAETTKVYFAITAKQRILIMQIATVRRADWVAAV